MTIDDILQKRETEQKIKSRFPSRMIFCESLKEYDSLTDRLKGACDCWFNLADFCTDKYPDKYPKFRKLFEKIEENQNKHILLLSVGEYLRMAAGFEVYSNDAAQFYKLWTRMESVYSKTRIFMPVFAAKEYFNRAVGRIDERQLEFLWDLDGDDENTYDLKIYSDNLKNYVSGGCVIPNLKEWLEGWHHYYQKSSPVLVTRQAANCEKTYGKVAIEIIESPYEYICGYEHDMIKVEKESSPEKFWAALMSGMSDGHSFQETILDAFNMKKLDSAAVISQWDCLEPVKQWYIWLWYQLYDSNEYATAVLKKLCVDELESVPEHIYNDIIYYIDSHPEWITERNRYLQSTIRMIPVEEFFQALAKMNPADAIKLMSGRTMEEKAFLIKISSRWLRKQDDSNTVLEIIPELEKQYPGFAAYLKTEKNLYKEYTDYFEWYKRKKIINRVVEEPLAAQDIEFLEARSYLMAKYNQQDSIAYWIDGLGIEWLSVICSVLDENIGDLFSYKTYIAKCIIPSDTAFNEQWALNSYEFIKRNRLDKISHNGMLDDRDYFLAVANQLQVVSDMAREVVGLLSSHEYVIITGDHGSSRLAALGFHCKGTIVPKGAKPMNFGRFCLLDTVPEKADYLPQGSMPYKFGDNHFLVMNNYGHFRQKGNAAGGNTDENAVAGEIHGGLTPEECIVPVIILHRKNRPSSIHYKIEAEKIRISGGKASVRISFDVPVQVLQVIPNQGICECVQEDDKSWMMKFSDMKEETELEIIADNKMLFPKKSLPAECRGIKRNDMGLGDL